jgi:DNA processing protein
MTQNDLKYAIALSLVPGVGNIAAKKLIAYCNGPEAIFKEKKRALLKIPGVGEKMTQAIQSSLFLRRAEEEIAFMEKKGIRAFYYLEKDYPQRLTHCEDGPIVLFSKGSIDLNPSKLLAFVGTRNATVKGKALCEELIKGLSVHQPVIVSGLAYGIDISAHKAALKYNLSTIAVMACGLDDLYPKTHGKIAGQIAHSGALISDYLSNTKILPTNFAERNRIIAGLVDAVIVVESSSKGGSLITADLANGYHRDVFAVPGRPDDSQSIGCNQLIKKNKAALIENVQDIEYLLGWEKTSKSSTQQTRLFIEMEPEEEELMKHLPKDTSISLDELSLLAELPVSQTTTLLLSLEFKGALRSLPGKMYQAV